MALLKTETQQPAEKLDYDIYYAGSPDGASDWLVEGDSIESAVVTAPAGLTVTSSNTGTRVKLWVSGGTSGATYKVTIAITTAVGRIKEDEKRFKIKEI